MWIKAKTKINLPVLWLWFCIQVLNIFLFFLFDGTLLWVESGISQGINDACEMRSNVTCFQGYSPPPICSLPMAYFCAGFLIILNVVPQVFDVREIYVTVTKYEIVSRTVMGRKNRLGHSAFYKVFNTILNVSIICNISLRLSRYLFKVDIDPVWDNVTYYGTTLGAVWSLLFFVQLVPYVGYLAIVLKLMFKETFICILYITAFSSPYASLFIRIFNYERSIGECDSNWKDFHAVLYSNTLLLFNMMNFAPDNQDVTSVIKQAQVTISRI